MAGTGFRDLCNSSTCGDLIERLFPRRYKTSDSIVNLSRSTMITLYRICRSATCGTCQCDNTRRENCRWCHREYRGEILLMAYYNLSLIFSRSWWYLPCDPTNRGYFRLYSHYWIIESQFKLSCLNCIFRTDVWLI